MNGSQLISLLTGQVSGQVSPSESIKGGAHIAALANGLYSGEVPEGGFQTLLDSLVVPSAEGEPVLDVDTIAGLLSGSGNNIATPAASASLVAFLAAQSGGGNINAPALPGESATQTIAIEAAAALTSQSGGQGSAANNPFAVSTDVEGDVILPKLAKEISLGVDNVGTGTSIETASQSAASTQASGAPSNPDGSDLAKIVGQTPENSNDKTDGKAAKSAGAAHANSVAVAAVLANAAANHNPVFGSTVSDGTSAAAANDAPVPPTGPQVPAQSNTDPGAAKQVTDAKSANIKGQLANNEGGGDLSGESEDGDGEGQGNSDHHRDGNRDGNRGGNGRRATLHGNIAPGANRGIATTLQVPSTRPLAETILAGQVGVKPFDPGLMLPPLDLAASAEIFSGSQNSSTFSPAIANVPGAQISALAATGEAQPATPSFVHNSNFVASQVGLQISKAVAEGDSTFKLKLNPPELGRVEARLEFSGDRVVKAHIVAESRETLNLLQRDAHVLERALNEAGLRTDSGSLNFSLKQQDDGRDASSFDNNGEGQSGNEIDSLDMDAIDVTEAVVTQLISDSAVDIRI